MDISIEGFVAYGGPATRDGFDQYAASLAQHGATDACGGLVVRSAVVTVTDSFLDIVLDEDDAGFGDGNAALKAIEVIQVP